MTPGQQPEALDMADWLEAVSPGPNASARRCAELLREQYAENQSLRTGYDAARLEIESLNARIKGLIAERDAAYEVAMMNTESGAAWAKAAQAAGEYLPLPVRYAYDDEGDELFSAAQMFNFVDADRAMRAQAAHAAVAGPVMTRHRTKDGILHFLTKEQMAEEIIRLDAALAAAPAAQAAPVAQGDAEDAASWRVINEQFIDDYLEDYELIGEAEGVGDCCYTPTETERDLIKDAVMGLLACAEDAARAQAKEGASHD